MTRVFLSLPVALLALGTVLPGQSLVRQGTGVATTYSYYDPLAPFVPTRGPSQTATITEVSRRTVLPFSDYLRLKTAPASGPSGAPGVESRSPAGLPTPQPRSPLALAPALSFSGISETLWFPPSPGIAAGPADMIQTVNISVARYDRSGNQTSLIPLGRWFNDEFDQICPSNYCGMGDVTITYDQMHGHFILMAQATDSLYHRSYLMLSVSKDATFSSGWKNWVIDETLDGSTSTTNSCDFPQPGIDNVAFYATTLQFGMIDGNYKYSKVRIFKKTDLYNWTATQLPYHDIWDFNNEDGSQAQTLQVANLRGRVEVATGAAVLMNSHEPADSSDLSYYNYYTLWLIQNPTADTSTVTRYTLGNLWGYRYPAGAPQEGSTLPLDTGPPSLARVIQRDGLLYLALNSGYSDEPVTVTYAVADIASQKVTLEQRRIGGNYFYPALDIPPSLGPGGALPNHLIAGTTTANDGSLTYPGVTDLKAGDGPYTVYSSSRPGLARWGEYFTGAVDPVNGGLWVTGEWDTTQPDGGSHWATWDAFYPAATSQQFDDVPGSRMGFDAINVMKLWSVTKGCTATLFCPDRQVTRAELAALVIRALYGETFTYTTTPYFTDVPSTHFAFAYVQKLRDLGITNGCDAALFCPDDAATRGMAAVFIIRAKMKKVFGESFSYPATAYFTDVASTDSTFPYVQKLRDMGITNGCSPTLFCPASTATREQAAVFIVRAFLN